MPKITVLPHEQLCPEGKTFEAREGASLARALLANFPVLAPPVTSLFAKGLIHSMNPKMKNLTVWIKLGV